MATIRRLEIERPLIQAGLGEGLSRHEPAAAVSAEGGLGTLGMMAARTLESELVRVRDQVSGRRS
jgi:NAD(P)H-dependent flavin oxidoreductase YrpB (nitropropane dioxygenase family)